MKYEAVYKRSRKVIDYDKLQGVYMTFEYHGREYEVYRPLNGYTGNNEKEQHEREQKRIDDAINNPKGTFIAVAGYGKAGYQEAVSAFFEIIEGEKQDESQTTQTEVHPTEK